MRRLLLPLPLLLFVCSVVHGQVTSQRVIFTSSNPPTVCAPGKLYSNATTKKLYQGAANSTCTDVTGGTAGDVVGPAASTNLGLARFDGTTGKLLKNSLTTLSDAGVFTFVSNKRQTFVPGAQQSGFNVGSVSSDPTIPTNGDIWYNSGSSALKAQINGSTVSLGVGVGGSGTLNTIPKFTPDGTHIGDSLITDDGTDMIAGVVGGVYMEINQTAHLAEFSTGGAAGVLANANLNESSLGDIDSVGNGTTFTVNDNNLTGTMIGTFRSTAYAPISAGSGTVGTPTVPFFAVTIGNAANTSSQLVSTASANQVAIFPDATGTVQLVGAAGTGQFVPLPVNNTVLATATGTVFTSPGNNGTALSATSETTVSWPIVVGSSGKTIRNLIVQTGTTAKVNTPVTVITVRVDGVATAVTVTMTQTVTTITADTAHTAALAAGNHLITVSLATTGTAAVSTSIAGISFEID